MIAFSWDEIFVQNKTLLKAVRLESEKLSHFYQPSVQRYVPLCSISGPENPQCFTFKPLQRSFEDYETAPQTVISISNSGDIRGMVLVKDKKPEDKVEEKTSVSNEKTVATGSTSSSISASNVVQQPHSKTTVPVVKKIPAPATSIKNSPHSNDTTSGNIKPPTVASIMADHLQSKSTPKQEIPNVKILPSQTAVQAANQPSQAHAQPKVDATTRKPVKVSGGYVGSAILKQPTTVDSKASVPSVYGKI